MIYSIKLFGHEDLRSSSVSISQNYPNLKNLIADMFETMHKAKGIGLSAIQIGIPIKLFVVEASLPEQNFHFREVFINPEIIKYSKLNVNHLEGCLSIPGISGFVNRPEEITIKYYDQNWKKKTKTYSNIESRIIQHEYDHLNGKLYIDSLNSLWKKFFEEPLKSIKNGKIKTEFLSECKS